jgi:hypothetical protein
MGIWQRDQPVSITFAIGQSALDTGPAIARPANHRARGPPGARLARAQNEERGDAPTSPLPKPDAVKLIQSQTATLPGDPLPAYPLVPPI